MNDGAWILEQFALNCTSMERNAARRAFAESMRQWPGATNELWWKWFDESVTSLGLRSKYVECSLDEVVQYVRDGAPIVIYDDTPESEWLCVSGRSGRKYRIHRAAKGRSTSRQTLRQVRDTLSSHTRDQRLYCVVVEPLSLSNQSGTADKNLRPLERLRRLLRPEWSDIWVVVVFSFVVGLLMLAPPIAVEALVNTVAFGRVLQPIIVLALILLTFLGFLAAMRALQTYVVEIIQRRMFARVAADLAQRIPRAEVEASEQHHMPELVNRFFDVVTVQKVIAKLLLDGLELILIAAIGMAVLAFYHPWLLGFDIFMLASISVIIFVLGRGATKSAIKESKSKYLMAAWLEDIARCPTTFRNDGGSDLALERTDRLISQYLVARKDHFRVLMRQIIFALGLQAVASTVLLGIGGWLVISGELTLGQLVAAELIVTMIVGAFAKMGKHLESFYDLLASVDKLGALFDLPIERQDGSLGTGSRGPFALTLNSVTYGWPGHSNVVDSVSSHVAARESLAILGNAGSGKSTMLDLIYGLRAPTAGHLLVNDFDPRDVRPDVLRQQVALVRGEEVFQGTIAENVHLNRPDVSASDVREALNRVGLMRTILRLEDGLDTELSSGGLPLSSSQCKLLGLARVIASRPSLILVDGILDALTHDDLEPVWQSLTAEDRPWTLVVATSRQEIADRCLQSVTLQGQPAIGHLEQRQGSIS